MAKWTSDVAEWSPVTVASISAVTDFGLAALDSTPAAAELTITVVEFWFSPNTNSVQQPVTFQVVN